MARHSSISNPAAIVIIAAVVVASTATACTGARVSVPISGGKPTVATTPTSQETTLGSALNITWSLGHTDGSVDNASTAVTVANLQPLTDPATSLPPRGALYSIDVTIQIQTGSLLIHPWYFAARTEDGTNLSADLSAVANGLPAAQVPSGQKVAGQIAYDVPAGKRIKEIVLSNGIGEEQLGRWLVP